MQAARYTEKQILCGIQDAVKNAAPDSRRIAPSTKIVDVLRGKSLEKFWSELSWRYDVHLPQLSSRGRKIEGWGHLFGSLVVFSMIPLALWGLNPAALVAMSACVLIGWLGLSVYKGGANPLPLELQTFRDLSMLIAAHDCDAVQKFMEQSDLSHITLKGNPVSVTRYSEKQILCGLRAFWYDSFLSCRPIELDTRIDLQIISYHEWDDDDLDEVFSRLPDLFSELANYFGFECPLGEWKKELGIKERVHCMEEWESEIAPHFTFGALVRFIEKRATAILFQPVTVIDRECRPAGVFYGIQQITKDAVGESKCFGPSTKIIDVLPGYKLEDLWSQLNWMTEYRIPQLPFFWSRIDDYCCSLCCLGFPLGIFATCMTQQFTYLIAIPVCALMGCFVSSLYKNRVNPLPPELQTFRDLAMLIASPACDAVRK